MCHYNEVARQFRLAADRRTELISVGALPDGTRDAGREGSDRAENDDVA